MTANPSRPALGPFHSHLLPICLSPTRLLRFQSHDSQLPQRGGRVKPNGAKVAKVSQHDLKKKNNLKSKILMATLYHYLVEHFLRESRHVNQEEFGRVLDQGKASVHAANKRVVGDQLSEA